MNQNYDWFIKFYDIDVFNAISTFAHICEKTRKSNSIFSNFNDANDLNRLNDKQREMFNLFINVYKKKCCIQLLIHLNDIANIDKSIMINIIFQHLIYYVSQKNQRNSKNTVLRNVFIDVTIHNIASSMLHSLFWIFVEREMKNLKKNNLIKLQKLLNVYWFLIIDEKFMMNCKFLYLMNRRLRQSRNKSHDFFDDMNILFCDDFDQLISINDVVFYFENNFAIDRLMYSTFDRIIVLKQFIRQQNVICANCLFREILNQLRNESIYKEN